MNDGHNRLAWETVKQRSEIIVRFNDFSLTVARVVFSCRWKIEVNEYLGLYHLDSG
jgi:hypothetical protein